MTFRNWCAGKSFCRSVAVWLAFLLCLPAPDLLAQPSAKSIFAAKRADHAAARERTLRELDAKQRLTGTPTPQSTGAQERSTGTLAISDQPSAISLAAPPGDLSAFHIPPEDGQVLEVWSPSDQGTVPRSDAARADSKGDSPLFPTVILLQDLHTQPEAQLAEGRILEHLVKTYNVTLVASEGATGPFALDFFQQFPQDKTLRTLIAKTFLTAGEMTGPEYQAITEQLPVTIYGVEDAALHREHGEIFKQILDIAPDAQHSVEQLQRALARLVPTLYPPALQAVTQQAEAFQQGAVALPDYVTQLATLAQQQGLSVEAIAPNLRRLQQLQPFLTQPDAPPDGAWHQVVDNVRRLQAHRLPAELEQLEWALTERLAGSEDARTLARLLRHAQLLHGAVALQLTPEQWAYVQAHREAFTARAFSDFLDRHGRTSAPEHRSVGWEERLLLIERFYALAVRRDEVLAERTLRLLEDREASLVQREAGDLRFTNDASRTTHQAPPAVVLVAGGFHTPGIIARLRERNIPYVVVSPTATGEVDEALYHRLIRGEVMPMAEKIALAKRLASVKTYLGALNTATDNAQFLPTASGTAKIAEALLPDDATIEHAVEQGLDVLEAAITQTDGHVTPEEVAPQLAEVRAITSNHPDAVALQLGRSLARRPTGPRLLEWFRQHPKKALWLLFGLTISVAVIVTLALVFSNNSSADVEPLSQTLLKDSLVPMQGMALVPLRETAGSYANRMERVLSLRTGKWQLVPIVAEFVKQLIEKNQEHIRIAEIGAATAGLLGAIEEEINVDQPPHQKQPVIEYTAIDIDDQLIQVGRNKHPSFNFVKLNLLSDDLTELADTQDAAVVAHILHEIYSSPRQSDGTIDVQQGERLVRKTASNIVSMVKPGGLVAFFDGVLPDHPDAPVRFRFKNRLAKEKFELFVKDYAAFNITPKRYKNDWEVEIPNRSFACFLSRYYYLPLRAEWKAFDESRKNQLNEATRAFLAMRHAAGYESEKVWVVEQLETLQYFTQQQYESFARELGLEVVDIKILPSFRETYQLDFEILTEGIEFPPESILLVARKRSASDNSGNLQENANRVAERIGDLTDPQPTGATAEAVMAEFEEWRQRDRTLDEATQAIKKEVEAEAAGDRQKAEATLTDWFTEAAKTAGEKFRALWNDPTSRAAILKYFLLLVLAVDVGFAAHDALAAAAVVVPTGTPDQRSTQPNFSITVGGAFAAREQPEHEPRQAAQPSVGQEQWRRLVYVVPLEDARSDLLDGYVRELQRNGVTVYEALEFLARKGESKDSAVVILGDARREAAQFGAYFDVTSDVFKALFLAVNDQLRTFEQLQRRLNDLDYRTLLQTATILTRV